MPTMPPTIAPAATPPSTPVVVPMLLLLPTTAPVTPPIAAPVPAAFAVGEGATEPQPLALRRATTTATQEIFWERGVRTKEDMEKKRPEINVDLFSQYTRFF